jgi:hypothetical protein
MLLFCPLGPACEDIKKGHEMVGPSGEDPVCDGDVQWRDGIWIGALKQLIGVKEVGERAREEGLNVSGLERMKAHTKSAYQGHILLRR